MGQQPSGASGDDPEHRADPAEIEPSGERNTANASRGPADSGQDEEQRRSRVFLSFVFWNEGPLFVSRRRGKKALAAGGQILRRGSVGEAILSVGVANLGLLKPRIVRLQQRIRHATLFHSGRRRVLDASNFPLMALSRFIVLAVDMQPQELAIG